MQDNPFIYFLVKDLSNGRHYYKKWTATGIKLGLSPEDAEDAYGNTVVKAATLKNIFDPTKGDAAGYLQIVYTRESIAIRRENAKKPPTHSASIIMEMVEDKGATNPLEALIIEEETSRAISLLNKLPPKKRTAIYLRYLQEKSWEEICEEKQVSRVTARNHTTRAIAQLRELYQNQP